MAKLPIPEKDTLTDDDEFALYDPDAPGQNKVKASTVKTYVGAGGGSGPSIIYSWNETDLTQIETTPFASKSGTDGVLSVDNFTLDPYAPAIRHTHTASSTGGWRMFRLLDDVGQPLDLPPRYRIKFRMGARNPPDSGTDGANSIPGVVPYLLDSTHYFLWFRDSTTESLIRTWAFNGNDTFSGTGTVGWFHTTAITIGPNNEYGQNIQIDVISRELSSTDDPAMEFQFLSWHATPNNFGINQSAAIWTPAGGAANDPDTAWHSGWNTDTPQIGAALMFYEFAGSAGFSQIGELQILTYGMDW